MVSDGSSHADFWTDLREFSKAVSFHSKHATWYVFKILFNIFLNIFVNHIFALEIMELTISPSREPIFRWNPQNQSFHIKNVKWDFGAREMHFSRCWTFFKNILHIVKLPLSQIKCPDSHWHVPDAWNHNSYVFFFLRFSPKETYLWAWSYIFGFWCRSTGH